MDGECSTKGGEEVIDGNTRRKATLGRPRCGWVDNIKMDLGDIGWSVVDWIGLAQDSYKWRALVNSVMNFRVQ
jgi:hypothetical protein